MRASDLGQKFGVPSLAKRRSLIAIAALATVAYVGAGFAVDAPRVREAIEALGWLGCGMVLALSILNYLVRFQRWQMFVRRFGHRLPGLRHLLYYLSGFAFTVSPAKAGEAVRSIYLREHDVSYSQSIAALFVERLLDLLAMALLASLVVFDRPAYRPLVAGALALVIALSVAASHKSLPALLEHVGLKLKRARIVAGLTALANLLRSSRELLQPRLLLIGTAVGVLSWGAEGLGYYLICQGLHLHVNLLVAEGIYALAVLAGTAAFLLPAGIGGMEVVMTTLLVAHGAPLRAALIATLLCRVATLWFAVLIGIGAATIIELRAWPDRVPSVP
jgi:glycosyltransferase 2 family protein